MKFKIRQNEHEFRIYTKCGCVKLTSIWKLIQIQIWKLIQYETYSKQVTGICPTIITSSEETYSNMAKLMSSFASDRIDNELLNPSFLG